MNIPRPEHPRPDFLRPHWENLNGTWQFAFDDADEGLAAGWYRPGHTLDRKITVPFCYQCEMSGINDTTRHDILWYRKAFSLPSAMRGKRVLLRFGAVDYQANVYVNGQMAGTHEGGYSPFSLDITALLTDGENDLCLRVEDRPETTQPRGKQNWKDKWFGCWYTPVSGIWQTVYLEAVGDFYLTKAQVTPDIDQGTASVSLILSEKPTSPLTATLTVTEAGRLICGQQVSLSNRSCCAVINLVEEDRMEGFSTWSPQNPALYDLHIQIEGQDDVSTYFGMRKVEVRDGWVLLNNRPLYQRLVLDQGYWPQSLLTPPSDEALRADIEWTIKFGYNGARKHQKVEDPRYYYWADKLGLLVWGEVPSAYNFTTETVRNLSQTFGDFIERDFNHPSIIAWVPLNESWGVPHIFANARMQEAARMLYHQAKAMDGTRLISANDGWEQTKTDIFALHDYTDKGSVLASHFQDRAFLETHACDHRMASVNSELPTGKEAFLVTEYGGIAFEEGDEETWGYHNKVRDEEMFFQRYQDVTDAVRALPYCQGYCYTQLTDVQQETNGLLTPDRTPKVDVDRFRDLTQNPDGRYR